MWSTVSLHDIPGITRYLEIMHRMDARYSGLAVPKVRSSIKRHRGEIHHYLDDDGCELVVSYFYSHRWQGFYLWSIGMAGGITPAKGLDLVVACSLDLLARHGHDHLYTIRPWSMDYAPAQELHDLTPLHPAIDVTVVGESADSAVWRVSYVPSHVERAISSHDSIGLQSGGTY